MQIVNLKTDTSYLFTTVEGRGGDNEVATLGRGK